MLNSVPLRVPSATLSSRPARLLFLVCSFSAAAAFVAGVGLVAGCSRLPEYAAPQGRVADPNELSGGDTIAYRTLTRSDFKASRLPANANAYAQKIGAMTCARVSTTADTGFVTRETRDASGAVSVEVRFQRLGFVALMDRDCSWWNPVESLPESYVLQHEQIHFAITELGARALNTRAPSLMRDIGFVTSSQDEAKSRMRDELEQLLQEAMDELVERHRDFDEDTSGIYEPAAQERWFQQVSEELEARSGPP